METADAESPAVERFPWYEAVTDGTLEQGDLLPNLPIVVVTSTYDDLLVNRVRARISRFDVIVLTQSCDLDAKKVENVIVCPHFAPSELAAQFSELGTPRGQDRIRQ